MTWWPRALAWLRALVAGGPRAAGRPTSANRASSFHLHWEVPSGVWVAAQVDLVIARPPAVSELYFWALQASFQGDGGPLGGAHLGLQWNPRHRGNTAANWGGYADQRLGGQILTGTESPLPSTPRDPNTRDYQWLPGRGYRLRIAPAPGSPGWWRGTITDLATGAEAHIRDLEGGGDRLTGMVMWSEVFARCDDPTVVAAWSNASVEDIAGNVTPVVGVGVNYQSHSAGGCANTDSSVAGGEFVQRTNSTRTTPQGARLAV